jgi:hypothetical protein
MVIMEGTEEMRATLERFKGQPAISLFHTGFCLEKNTATLCFALTNTKPNL